MYFGWLSKLWPFLGTLNIRCRIIIGIQKGTITVRPPTTSSHILGRCTDPDIFTNIPARGASQDSPSSVYPRTHGSDCKTRKLTWRFEQAPHSLQLTGLPFRFYGHFEVSQRIPQEMPHEDRCPCKRGGCAVSG